MNLSINNLKSRYEFQSTTKNIREQMLIHYKTCLNQLWNQELEKF